MHLTTTGGHKDALHQKPCCTVAATVHTWLASQLLCSRFGAMWDGNLREATKFETLHTGVPSQPSRCWWTVFGNTTLPVSSSICWEGLLRGSRILKPCSRWVESPCTRLMVPTGQLRWTRGGCALVTSSGMPKLVGFGYGMVWYLDPDFHTLTSQNCTSSVLGHSAVSRKNLALRRICCA